MSNGTLKDALASANVSVPQSTVSIVSSKDAVASSKDATVFNLLSVFNEIEIGYLSGLLSVRYKAKEIESLAKEYPSASSAELFIIGKMKEAAEDERVASVWRSRGVEWKSSTLSYARQVFHEVKPIQEHAIKSLAKLAGEIPKSKHKDVIGWLQTKNALDCASSDERIAQVQKVFDNN